MERRNPGESPAVFAPGADATEELELSDAEMIAAIERVRRAVAKARPAPGRLRTRVALAAAVLIVAGGALMIPEALIRQAARVAPPAARAEIGAQLVAHVERLAGAPCSSPAGDRALLRLETRLLGPEGGRIVVLGDGLATAAHVPGGTILLSHELLENYETPEVAAGYILNERVAAMSSDPLLRLLDWTGTGAAFSLLTSGEVPDENLQDYAEYLLASGSEAMPDAALLAAFGEARVRATPYAQAMAARGRGHGGARGGRSGAAGAGHDDPDGRRLGRAAGDLRGLTAQGVRRVIGTLFDQSWPIDASPAAVRGPRLGFSRPSSQTSL